MTTVSVFTGGSWQDTPVYDRAQLQPGDAIAGPALIVEATGTNMIEPGWEAGVGDRGGLVVVKVAGVNRSSESGRQDAYPTELEIGLVENNGRQDAYPTELVGANGIRPPVDPVRLEIFNHLFRAIAEQMGITLQNTSSSVNIKERLDFSCAIFDALGQLVANAPHIPVHLGSMSESVAALMDDRGATFQPGDVYVSNDPYHGGTHLPDITVITPVFLGESLLTVKPDFFVASRGHHADIGGIAPGSMPPDSQSILEEGILLQNVLLVRGGKLLAEDLKERLASGPYPARNPEQNLADLQAQIAANARGSQALAEATATYGLAVVRAYAGHVQAQAAAAVRRAIAHLQDGRATVTLDNGAQIGVAITVDRSAHHARIDFTGTSPQQTNNFNAPQAITKAAVLYVFRTLVADEIPLNSGCLEPLEIVIPEGCFLAPRSPAAVVAGNVETSQAIVDALYQALGILANGQGTMNNFTFGNDRHQYYETICGGAGAGRFLLVPAQVRGTGGQDACPTELVPAQVKGTGGQDAHPTDTSEPLAGFAGADAVQIHMTNSRLTDPEVLEWRFPVLVETFAIRPDSGGAGQWRGGNGVIRRIRFLEAMTAAIVSGRRSTVPQGLAGGQPGQPGRNWLERINGDRVALGSAVRVQVAAGEAIVIETPGGGGMGKPEEGNRVVWGFRCNSLLF